MAVFLDDAGVPKTRRTLDLSDLESQTIVSLTPYCYSSPFLLILEEVEIADEHEIGFGSTLQPAGDNRNHHSQMGTRPGGMVSASHAGPEGKLPRFSRHNT